MKTCSAETFYLVLAISGSIVLADHEDGPSENLYRFLTLVSGYFENKDQLSTDQCSGTAEYHERSTSLWKPVEIESFHDESTLYLEGTINGQVRFRSIWAVSEDHCGVIHVKVFEILNSDSYGPGELQKLDLNHFEFRHQNNDSNCELLFYSVDENVFVGTTPGCLGVVPGTLPLDGQTFTCHSVTFHVCNIQISDRVPVLPYIEFKKYSYPLTRAMNKGANFETKCFYPHLDESNEESKEE